MIPIESSTTWLVLLFLLPMMPTASATTVNAQAPALPDPLHRLDSLHQRRDDPVAQAEARRVADQALAAAPGDYRVLWRAARVLFTESDDPSRTRGERERFGKQAYDLAERAISANPEDVAGHYWAALSIGSVGDGMGVLQALANGIEGKFKRPLERASVLDVGYDHGNIPVVWAAYFLALPWPKRDRSRAAQELRRALEINPANLRARLYQAHLAVDEGRPDDARALLAAIAAARVGSYDPPEERRVKKEAATMAATLR